MFTVYMTSAATILDNIDDIDPLTEVEVALVTTRQLREGMVLLDPDFDVPAGVIDQRVSTGTYNIWTVDDHKFVTGVRFIVSRKPTIRVAANLRVAY